MRIRSIIATAGLLLTASFAMSSGTARADGEFSVATSPNSVTLTANSPWHINSEVTWKVKDAATHKTVDGVHFTLTDTTASATGVPSGSYVLKGAVCNLSTSDKRCLPVSRDITIP